MGARDVRQLGNSWSRKGVAGSRPWVRRGLCAGAVVAALAPLAATAAVSPETALFTPGSAGGEVRYDRASRTLHLGESGREGAGAVPVQITIARAANFVGQPLRQVNPPRTLATGTLLDGALPTGLPLARPVLTSSFGLRVHPILGGWREHAGVDLAALSGTPVAATSAGVVTGAGWAGGYGELVSIDHGHGIETRYGHMSRLNVSAGQRVRPGDVIGFVGSTGRSTGPHLHYEVRVDGRPVNPLSAERRGRR